MHQARVTDISHCACSSSKHFWQCQDHLYCPTRPCYYITTTVCSNNGDKLKKREMCTQLLMAVCDASSPPCCHAGVDRTALREIKLLQELSHPNIIGVSTLCVCTCGWVGVGMVGGSHDRIILIVCVVHAWHMFTYRSASVLFGFIIFIF